MTSIFPLCVFSNNFNADRLSPSIKKFIWPLPLSTNNSLSSSNTGVCVSRISFIISLCSSKTKPYFFPLTSFSIWFKYNSRFPVFSSCGAEAIYFRISFILSNRSSLFFFEMFILISSSTILNVSIFCT